jgi:hypothetical protein
MLGRVLNLVCVAAFACIVLGFGFVEWQLSSEPAQAQDQNRAADSAGQKAAQDRNEKTIWQPNDPVSAYTFVLAIFTGLLVLVSGVQIRFLTRADKIARITADAVRDQAALTRETMIKTQRAFVLVKALEIEPLTVLHQSPTGPLVDRVVGWRIGVKWENSGDTPTRDLFTHISLKSFDSEIPNNYDFPDLPDRSLSKALVGPRGTISSASFAIPVEQAQTVRAGAKYLYMWGWAEYDDVFPSTPRHRTEFCFEFLFSEPFPQKTSISHLMHGSHNGAEDECLKPTQTKSRQKH